MITTMDKVTPNKAKTISVILAEDESLMRHTIKSIVEDKLGYQVIAETDNGIDAEKLCRSTTPDLLITDLGLPELSGDEVVKRLLKDMPDLKILVFSVFTDYQLMVDLIAMGAKGFLHKREEFSMVETAIKAVAEGKLFVCGPTLSSESLKLRPMTPVREMPPNKLTEREKEILVHIAEGNTYKEIASKLGISFKTVEKHRSRISQKLAIRDNVGLALFAVKCGMIES